MFMRLRVQMAARRCGVRTHIGPRVLDGAQDAPPVARLVPGAAAKGAAGQCCGANRVPVECVALATGVRASWAATDFYACLAGISALTAITASTMGW